MNWKALHAGKITKAEIMEAIPDRLWQDLRISMLGASLSVKYSYLENWLKIHQHSRRAQVQVTNYINALKRGGLIETE